MSPIFGYVLLFMIWASFAVVIWTVAAILAIRQRTRRIGRCLFWAMATGVIMCQIVAASAAVVLAAGWLFWRITEPGATTTTPSPVVGAVSLSAALFVFCLLAVMSLIGFYQSWRVGWAYGSGMQLRNVLEAAAPVRWFRTLVGKLHVRA